MPGAEGGRRNSVIREAWRDLIDGKKTWQCLYCPRKLVNNISRMRMHSLFDCRTIPDAERKRLMDVLCVPAEDRPEHLNLPNNDTNDPNDLNEDEIQAIAFKRAAEKDSVEPVLKQKSILTGPYCDTMKKEEQEIYEKLLLKAMISSNVPFSLFENNPNWSRFFEAVRPTFKVPSRNKLSGALLDNEYMATKKMVNTELSKNSHLALQSDGWSGINTDSIINYLAFFSTLSDVAVADVNIEIEEDENYMHDENFD